MDFAVRRAIDESKLIEGPLTKEIIGAAIEVHCHLGPGLVESAYEICLSMNWLTEAWLSGDRLMFPSVIKV